MKSIGPGVDEMWLCVGDMSVLLSQSKILRVELTVTIVLCVFKTLWMSVSFLIWVLMGLRLHGVMGRKMQDTSKRG